MKIAVISNAPGHGELGSKVASKPVPEGMEWVWVKGPEDAGLQKDVDLFIDLDFVPEPERIDWLANLLPTMVMVNSVTHTLTDIGRPFIRINAWPGFLAREIHELVVPDAGTGDEISRIYDVLGWKYRLVPDQPGMISARILSAIINEAFLTLEEGVSTGEEIDTAMKLGTNYPKGPFEWANEIGLENISQLLSKLGMVESRYMPAEALKSGFRD